MASEIKVDTIVNAGGDNDSGIDLSTNDNIKFNIAGSQKAMIDSNGRLGIGTSSPDTQFVVANGSDTAKLNLDSDSIDFFTQGKTFNLGTTDSTVTRFFQNNAERFRIHDGGDISFAKTTADNTNAGITIFAVGAISATRDAGVPGIINRLTNDGQLFQLKQDDALEGTISVSGSTVGYNGFSGSHESSGIATDTPIGTVVSTIDELDVYASKQGDVGEEEDNPKAGQTRKDHAKVEVSDTVGDSAVYGVVSNFNAQGKVNVASVGIGSVRVTGACAKGDLLESNGDGTAKVQSDDIVRSKTIGKVTIGNSSTDVKLVSCVLYCG